VNTVADILRFSWTRSHLAQNRHADQAHSMDSPIRHAEHA
jgi:hypothetical protein